jgi:hypothetical protein
MNRCGEGPFSVHRTPTKAGARSLTATPSEGERPGVVGSGTRTQPHHGLATTSGAVQAHPPMTFDLGPGTRIGERRDSARPVEPSPSAAGSPWRLSPVFRHETLRRI